MATTPIPQPQTPVPTTPAPTDGMRPATVDEVITALAKKEGINPKLALAVAKRESSLDPNVKPGDAGKAIGLFQLHEPAAIDTGTADRNDPVQNITGGVRYLKQLNDRYQGDLTKVLQAYNGGSKWVDEGKVSPQAVKYAEEVIASLMPGATPSPQGAPAAAAPPQDPDLVEKPIDPKHDKTHLGRRVEPPGMLQQMGQDIASSFDPRTTAGRVNLGATAAATAATAWAGGVGGGATAAGVAGRAAMPAVARMVGRGVLPWIARSLAPPAAAAVAGGGIMAAEQAAGTAPKDSNSPLKEGAIQGALEAGGGLVGWGIRRLARPVLASRVGKEVRRNLDDTIDTLRRAVGVARESFKPAITAAQDAASAGVTAAKERKEGLMGRVAEDVYSAKTTAREVGARGVQKAEQESVDSIAQAELNAASELADAKRQVERVSHQPSVEGAATATRDVLKGQPGILGDGTGAASRGLDILGKRVKEAAKKGPNVNLGRVQEALQEMARKVRPAEMFGNAADETAEGAGRQGIGFGGRPAAEIVRYAAADKAAVANFKATTPWRQGTPEYNQGLEALRTNVREQFTAGELNVAENHPLPGVLGQLMDAPEEISFETAHAIKALLDENVNFDAAAKRHLERLTKGVRTALRGAMKDAGNTEYESASKAYMDAIPLYRKGVGRRLIQAAGSPDGASKIAAILKSNSPDGARRVRELLVDQSKLGGDEAAGREAWNAVRGTFTYDNVIKGDPAKLSDRVKAIVANKEFAREVYGDEAGQAFLSNLSRIGDAVQAAMAKVDGAGKAAKATGKAGVEAAQQRSTAGIEEAAHIGSLATKAADQQGTRDIRQATKAGTAAVRAVTQGKDAAITAGKAQLQNVKDTRKDFLRSSIGPWSTRMQESEAADWLRIVGLGPGTIWGMLSMVRMLNSPNGGDIVEWAAMSNKNTQMLTGLLMNQFPDRAVPNIARSIIAGSSGAPSEPVASHPQASQASGQ